MIFNPSPLHNPTESQLLIHLADSDDLGQIMRLEQQGFVTQDAQTARSLRYLLRHANAAVMLAVVTDVAAGYVSVLFRQNSSVARLYSITVCKQFRKCGVARALVLAAQASAVQRGAAQMRLEVRAGNLASRQLFAGLGYAELARLPGYYPDGEDGIRMQKSLRGEPDRG